MWREIYFKKICNERAANNYDFMVYHSFSVLNLNSYFVCLIFENEYCCVRLRLLYTVIITEWPMWRIELVGVNIGLELHAIADILRLNPKSNLMTCHHNFDLPQREWLSCFGAPRGIIWMGTWRTLHPRQNIHALAYMAVFPHANLEPGPPVRSWALYRRPIWQRPKFHKFHIWLLWKNISLNRTKSIIMTECDAFQYFIVLAET